MNQTKTKLLLDRLKKVECPDTTFFGDNFPIVMKRAKGLKVVDVDDKSYLDFTSCFGVLALGHNSETSKRSISKQMKRLIHGMGDVHPTEEKIKLLEFLAKVTPFEQGKSLLGLSGGDAVETALKTAILATGRHSFLSFQGGYHGLQFGPLTLNSNPVFTTGFESWIAGKCVTLNFPYIEGKIFCEKERPNINYFIKNHGFDTQDNVLTKLESELKTLKYAAIVLEPIQGRGGQREFSSYFLKLCSELCRKYGTLLIFDEIFTGFGRTGKMFAFEHSGVIPDLMCIGKALGGGLPISACIGDIMDIWGKSSGEARHTQTFLGHPLACAVALKVGMEIQKKLPLFELELNLIEKEWIHFIKEMKLKNLDKLFPFEVRGRGLMKAIWFYNANEGFCVTLMEELLKLGIIILPEGARADVLSITPPLNTKAQEMRILFKKIILILSKISLGRDI